MTINTTNRKAGPYTGDGINVAFPFSFNIFAAPDVLVVKTDSAGLETVLTSGYTVTLNADQKANPGGTVTLATPLPVGVKLTLTTSLPYLQQVDLTNQGGFYPEVVTSALDRLVIYIQQLAEATGRALKTAISTPDGVGATLPAPRANYVLGWNDDGTGFKNYAPVDNTLLAAALAAPEGVQLVGNAADRRALAASAGASLLGYLAAGTGATARTAQDKLRDAVSVKDFGAKGDGATDDRAAMQAALDYLNSVGGGTLFFPPGDYRHALPLKTYSNIRLIGASRESVKLTKTGNGTLAVGAAANTSLVCLDLASMGSSGNVNCSIWIDAPIRALNVEIAHLTIQSTGMAATTAPVRHGICGVGASDSWIHDITFQYFSSASLVLPVFFFGTIERIKSYRCGQGISLEAGTSVNIHNNYSIYCQRYGYYLRGLYYFSLEGNACDGLNNVSNAPDYTDRSVYAVCYVLDACTGGRAEGNGAEQCYGTWFLINSCVSTSVRGNVSVGPASNYTGGSHVALWRVKDLGQGVAIEENTVLRGGVTALQGSASAAQHHDIYADVVSQNQGFRFRNNWTCNNKFDAPSTVWGNNSPSYLSTLQQGVQLSGEFTPTLSLVNAASVSISYGTDNKGRYSIIDGWMHIDIYLHIASVSFTNTTNIYAQIGGLPIANKAANSANLLVDYTAGVTWASTEPYWLAIDPAAKTGLIRNRTQALALGSGATPGIASGSTNVYIHCSGRVFVGDQVNII